MAKHRVDLTSPGVRPIKSTAYSGPKAREFEKGEIDKTLRMSVIEPAQPEWASPIVFERNENDLLRFCIDYRSLNAVTIKKASQSREWTSVSTP